MHVQRKIVLWWSHPPQDWHLAFPAGPVFLLNSLGCGVLLPSPSGCFHTANPCPFPGIDLQSLSLGAQPLTRGLRLGCTRQWYRLSVGLSLCFALLGLAAVHFSKDPRLPASSWSTPCHSACLPVHRFCHSFLPGVLVTILLLFLSFYFVPFVLHMYMEV